MNRDSRAALARTCNRAFRRDPPFDLIVKIGIPDIHSRFRKTLTPDVVKRLQFISHVTHVSHILELYDSPRRKVLESEFNEIIQTINLEMAEDPYDDAAASDNIREGKQIIRAVERDLFGAEWTFRFGEQWVTETVMGSTGFSRSLEPLGTCVEAPGFFAKSLGNGIFRLDKLCSIASNQFLAFDNLTTLEQRYRQFLELVTVFIGEFFRTYEVLMGAADHNLESRATCSKVNKVGVPNTRCNGPKSLRDFDH